MSEADPSVRGPASDPGIPSELHRLFWDCDPGALHWEEHRDFIVRRVLVEGGWSELSWLRRRLGDRGLAGWLKAQGGGRLSPRQLRFWQVVLDLSPETVDPWVERARRGPWADRARR